MYPAKIGHARGWSKLRVDYYVKKLEKAGLIRRLKRSNFVDYELTERGPNFLIIMCGSTFQQWRAQQAIKVPSAICQLSASATILFKGPVDFSD